MKGLCDMNIKKDKIILIIIFFLFLILIKVIIHYREFVVPKNDFLNDSLPPLVIINNNLYQLRDSEDYKNNDITPTGTIKKIIPLNFIPTENEQANFGENGMEYWITDADQNHLVIKLKDKLLKFELIDIDVEDR